MALAYIQPGVTVTEIVSPITSPFLTAATNLCIVGVTAGLISGKDVVALNDTSHPIAIPSVPQTATMPSTLTSVTDSSSTAVYGSGVDYTFTVVNNPPSTALTQLQSATDTTLNVTSSSAFSSSGCVLIDNEYISYSGKTGTTLTGCIRGVANTVPTAHNNASTVTQAKYTIVALGSTSPNATVILRYTYTPADYFTATRFDNLGAIQERYGPALDANNNIVSDLTFAAQCAFENGAASIVCQPLFYNNSGVYTQPIAGANSAASGSWANASTWSDTYQNSLRNIEDVNVIVPAIGQSRVNVGDAEQVAILSATQDHLAFMNTQQQYIVALMGEDSSASSGVASQNTLQAHAATLQARQGGAVNSQIVLIAPAKYTRQVPSSVRAFYTGGQFVAAAMGGMLAARRVSQALTRQAIGGFTSVAETRTKAQKNADAQVGLCVVDQRGFNVQVRHAITLDQTSTASRELSVMRAKFRMISSVRTTLENDIIGRVIADGSAPSVVANSVAGVLEQLKIAGDLVDYKGIQARTLSLDPTTVEVRFSYKPAFPLNYVNVIFSLDLTGDAGVTLA